ncbi:MAG: pantetheine-phosphate adenylyltransferase [Desulfobulbaceae bacterium]|jgi:pantetheine-phosphate adenylyltransferase|nr:pantetheine-phosphate adenylyltransferase [Desulfobulbaceae bacterium]
MSKLPPRRPTLAVYSGTFDPITNGHIDIVQRAMHLFDKVIITIARNANKTPLFSLEERVDMIRTCFLDETERIEVDVMSGLLVEYATRRGATAIVRGLRAVSDFDYEMQLALVNRKLERQIDTVFLMAGLRWVFLSSSMVRDVARHGGDTSGLVPSHVRAALKNKFL